jgi:hypothetical protein
VWSPQMIATKRSPSAVSTSYRPAGEDSVRCLMKPLCAGPQLGVRPPFRTPFVSYLYTYGTPATGAQFVTEVPSA